VNIIQKRYLGTDHLPARADGRLEFYLYHVSGLEAATIDYAVDQCLVEIDDQRFLVWPDSGGTRGGVRRLAPGY
jgi:hypothetical protein